MIRGAAFDCSHVHTREMKFSNAIKNGHVDNLEYDYQLLRKDGFTFFRDSCWLPFSMAYSGSFNWSYLDRLAAISEGNIQLSISHYDLPKDPKRLIVFCKELAKRYKGVFHSYIPAVEIGFWASMVGNGRWYPYRESWWQAYKMLMPMFIEVAATMKNADPDCRIAMAEPWGMPGMNWTDQARPFNNMLGKWDKTAFENKCFLDGSDYFLDIIGLNIYHSENINETLCIASQMFPTKEIMITETSNVFRPNFTTNQWIDLIEQEIKLTRVETVCWAPAITMFTIEDGKPMGGSLYDLNRNKLF